MRFGHQGMRAQAFLKYVVPLEFKTRHLKIRGCMSNLFSDLLVGNINCLPSFLTLYSHPTSNFKPRKIRPRKSLHFTKFIKMATLTCSPLNAQRPIGLDDFFAVLSQARAYRASTKIQKRCLTISTDKYWTLS